jgi:hypothetical protein
MKKEKESTEKESKAVEKKEMKKDIYSNDPKFQEGVRMTKEAIEKDLKKMSKKKIDEMEKEFQEGLKNTKKESKKEEPKKEEMKKEEPKKEGFKLKIPSFNAKEIEQVKKAFSKVNPLTKVILFGILNKIEKGEEYLTDEYENNSVTKDIIKNLIKLKSQMK